MILCLVSFGQGQIISRLIDFIRERLLGLSSEPETNCIFDDVVDMDTCNGVLYRSSPSDVIECVICGNDECGSGDFQCTECFGESFTESCKICGTTEIP